MRLNIASDMLTSINVESRAKTNCNGVFSPPVIPANSGFEDIVVSIILRGIAVRTASMRFDSGPANAVTAVPATGFLKLYSLMGTGLLHPNFAKTIISAPIGSMCASGFSVIRPSILAVLSPCL